MKKKIITSIVAFLIIVLFSFSFVACNVLGGTGEAGVGIASIEKTNSVGLVDTYTITMTDGKTTTFTVTNGTNGQDGANASGDNSTSSATPNAVTPDQYFVFSLLEDDTYEVLARYKDMPARIVIPSSYNGRPVTQIAQYFSGYSSSSDRNRTVEEIVLPNTITTIKSGAFVGYKALKKISIPAGVTKIGMSVFWRLSDFTIDYQGTKESWDAIEEIGYEESSYLEDYTLICSDGEFEINPHVAG